MAKPRAVTTKRSQPNTRRIGRPPNQAGEETRQRILLAARECFSRVGFERATNQEIAAQANVTAAALYRYFDSKAELWNAAVHAAMGELVPRLRRTIEAQTSVRATIPALLTVLNSANDSERIASRFLSTIPDEMQRHPELRKRVLNDPGEVLALVSQVVEMGVKSGELTSDKAQRAISFTIAMLMGISAYSSTVGAVLGQHATLGFIDLLEGRLFGKPTSRARRF